MMEEGVCSWSGYRLYSQRATVNSTIIDAKAIKAVFASATIKLSEVKYADMVTLPLS